MDLEASQTSLVRELFVRTADQNYVAARWCAFNELDTDFFWLAVHALEKYLKAALLLNGGTSRGYQHDIVRLYANVSSLAGDLLPVVLQQPVGFSIDNWRPRSPESFMAHLYKQGQPDNRYGIYGYMLDSQDLHMLDTMVFAVRRLICRLDDRVMPASIPGAPTFSYREELKCRPQHYNRMGMPLEELISANGGSPLRTAALNLNMAFAPQDFPHSPIVHRFAFRGTVIARRVFDQLNSEDAATVADGVAVALWLLEKVQLPTEGQKEIKAAVAAAKAKHRLP